MRVVVRGLLPVVAVAVLLWPAGVAAALSDSGVRATLGQVSCPDPTKAGAVQVTMAVETDSSTPSPYTVTVVNGQDPAGSGTTSGMVAPDATDRPALHTVVVDAMVHIQVTSGDEIVFDQKITNPCPASPPRATGIVEPVGHAGSIVPAATTAPVSQGAPMVGPDTGFGGSRAASESHSTTWWWWPVGVLIMAVAGCLVVVLRRRRSGA